MVEATKRLSSSLFYSDDARWCHLLTCDETFGTSGSVVAVVRICRYFYARESC